MGQERTFTLTDRFARFVDEQVASGRHQDASEVVREALRRYEQDVAVGAEWLEAAKRVAEVGLAEIAAGNYEDAETSEEIRSFVSRAVQDARKEAAGTLGGA